MTTGWPDAVDEILGADQVVGFAYVTPARGVVLTPLTNFGVRDRDGGTISPLSTSIGLWKKLERIQRQPRVAIAYHTREHSSSDRGEYVLVQGNASFDSLSDPSWLESNRASWEHFAEPDRPGPLWRWWLRVYHRRVGIQIAVERIVVWPNLACRGVPEVHGAPLPAEPPEPQRPPARGSDPRVDHLQAAATAKRLPNLLLGWTGTDGFPLVVPVQCEGTTERGIVLEPPDGVVPEGGRRAGLLAHSFARYTYGQNQRKHTGWLEPDFEAKPGTSQVLYAPHTKAGYRLPASRLLFRLASGAVTRRGYREGRRAGFLPDRGLRA